MVKYNEVKIIYSSPCFPPEGIKMDTIYSVVKKNGELYITDGVKEIKVDEFTIKTLFSSKDKEIEWKDIEFADSIPTKK